MLAIPIRRLVSGPKSDGTIGLVQDSAAPHVVALNQATGLFRTDIWASASMPVDNACPSDPTATWPDDRFGPLPNGTSFFVMQIPPDQPGQMPTLHQTESLDYVIVLQGEVHLVLADEARLVKQGDILVQRGAPHAWSNRSGQPCTFAAIMVDAKRS